MTSRATAPANARKKFWNATRCRVRTKKVQMIADVRRLVDANPETTCKARKLHVDPPPMARGAHRQGASRERRPQNDVHRSLQRHRARRLAPSDGEFASMLEPRRRQRARKQGQLASHELIIDLARALSHATFKISGDAQAKGGGTRGRRRAALWTPKPPGTRERSRLDRFKARAGGRSRPTLGR